MCKMHNHKLFLDIKKKTGSRTKCVRAGGGEGIKNCQQAYAELIRIEIYPVKRNQKKTEYDGPSLVLILSRIYQCKSTIFYSDDLIILTCNLVELGLIIKDGEKILRAGNLGTCSDCVS